MIPAESLFYFSAILVLVVTGAGCAAVRWFHMCRPFDEKGELFYPARRYVVCFYLTVLLLVPCLFEPLSEPSIALNRSYGILCCPAGLSVICQKYFRGYGMRRNLPVISAGLLALSWLVIMTLMSLELFSINDSVVSAVTIAVGAVGMVSLIYSVDMLRSKIKEYSRENYSNSASFPFRFAKILTVVPIVLFIVLWGVYFCDNLTVTSVFNLVLSTGMWIYLIVILHPQSTEIVDEVESVAKSEMIEKENSASKGLSPEQEQHFVERLEHAMNVEQLFLNPNLTLADIAKAIGTNRSYASSIIVRHHGSFMYYVNALRVGYARKLIEDNPQLTQREVMLQSGFGSPASYRKWMRQIDL